MAFESRAYAPPPNHLDLMSSYQDSSNISSIFHRPANRQLATKQYFKENDFNSHRNSKNNLGKAFRSSKTEERSNYSGDFWKLRVWSSSRGCQQRERMAWWTWKGLRAFRQRKMGKTQREESVRNQKSSNRLVMFNDLLLAGIQSYDGRKNRSKCTWFRGDFGEDERNDLGSWVEILEV